LHRDSRLAHNPWVADDAEGGRPLPGEPSSPTTTTPSTVPEIEVFGDVTALADSLLYPPQDGLTESTARPVEEGTVVPARPPAPDAAESEGVTDEERNRYGSLLDRAAERGLLEPSEYEVRLRDLAQATSTEAMMQIVTELPVFNPLTQSSRPRKSRPARHTMTRAAAHPEPRRRVTVWALLALLVVVAVASLVILAVSAERLTHRQGGGSGTGPATTRVVSGPRL
jgi:hypothetical protein